MTIKLPYVLIPDFLTSLLQKNANAGQVFFDYLKSEERENVVFRSLIQYGHRDFCPTPTVEFLIKSFGWSGLRDNLAALVVAKVENNYYPHSPDKSLVHDVAAFEQGLEKFVVEGYGRAYLLGLYFKLAKSDGHIFSFLDEGPGLFSRGVLQCLSQIRSKTIRIDWLLLLLIHFECFLGEAKLLEFVKKGTNFADIAGEISAAQEEVMQDNFLSYGASIGESDFFIHPLVD